MKAIEKIKKKNNITDHTNNMFMFYILCIRKRVIVSFLQYDYDLDFVHQKEGNCIIPVV